MSSEVITSQPEYRAWLGQLKYIRQWHLFRQAPAIGQQAVAQMEPQIVHSAELDAVISLKLGGLGYEF